MKFGSLFAGISGFDLGFDRAGMKCSWQVEIDPQCRNLLEQKWPNVERYEDVRKCGSGNLEPVDLIAGGFPCQDVSVAGRRAGLDGERSGLWFEFHRILAETHPRWVIIENVPGLLSSNEGRDFAVIIRGLADFGYGVAYRILDAQYFGVAQRRRRVFIIGSLGNGSAAEILFESESLRRNPAPSRETRKVAPAIPASGAGTSRTGNARTEADMMIAAPSPARQGKGGFTDPANDGIVTGSLARGNRNDPQTEHLISHALKASGNFKQDDTHETYIAAPLRSRQSPNSNAPGRGGEDDENIVFGIMPMNSSRDYKARETDVSQPITTGGNQHGNQGGDYVVGFTPGNSADSYGIGEQEEISPPVRGGGAGAKPTIAIQHSIIGRKDEAGAQGKGYRDDGASWTLDARGEADAVGDEFGVRRLTPTECERLQGFPDGWTDGFADTVRYRMLGNAVCVPVAEWIGRRILEFDLQ